MNFILHDYQVVESTIDEAKALLAKGAAEGTIVRAERQTAGRGRRGRVWISEPGNIYCTLILMPDCLLSQASQLSFVTAVAVGEAILPFLDASEILSYKWPNDLLLNGEKVAGILIETESQGSQMAQTCVVSVGLNLNSIPNNPDYPVTALMKHSSLNVNREMVFPELLAQIDYYYQLWKEKGFEPIRTKWLERAFALGQNMTATMGNQQIFGTFIGINDEGVLLLEDEGGVMHNLMSAEVR